VYPVISLGVTIKVLPAATFAGVPFAVPPPIKYTEVVYTEDAVDTPLILTVTEAPTPGIEDGLEKFTCKVAGWAAGFAGLTGVAEMLKG
jgi:hypothetical protein